MTSTQLKAKLSLAGDTILADRGFDICDSVGLYAATNKIPVFTKKHEGIDVESMLNE